MKCKKCGRELRKDWNYCPYCGEKIRKGIFDRFNNEDENNDIDREIESQMEEMLAAFGFPNIKIKFQTVTPKVRRQTTTQQRSESKKHIRNVKSVIEPKVTIKNISGETRVDIFLPEVVSIKDIFIKRLEESIEIRAYSKDKLYFKVIPISENAKIVNRKFSNSILSIVIRQ
jgi:hypothetical protein